MHTYILIRRTSTPVVGRESLHPWGDGFESHVLQNIIYFAYYIYMYIDWYTYISVGMVYCWYTKSCTIVEPRYIFSTAQPNRDPFLLTSRLPTSLARLGTRLAGLSQHKLPALIFVPFYVFELPLNNLLCRVLWYNYIILKICDLWLNLCILWFQISLRITFIYKKNYIREILLTHL